MVMDNQGQIGAVANGLIQWNNAQDRQHNWQSKLWHHPQNLTAQRGGRELSVSHTTDLGTCNVSVLTIVHWMEIGHCLICSNDILPMNVIGEATMGHMRAGTAGTPSAIKCNPIDKSTDLDVVTVAEVTKSEGRSWLRYGRRQCNGNDAGLKFNSASSVSGGVFPSPRRHT